MASLSSLTVRQHSNPVEVDRPNASLYSSYSNIPSSPVPLTPRSDAYYSPRSNSNGYTPCPGIPTDAGQKLSRFLRRLFKFRQMDFEYAAWQMVYLIISPQKVYRNFQYRKHMKYQWARDDPAFLVLFCLVLAVSSIFFGLALHLSVVDWLKLVVWLVCVDCIGVGLVVAFLFWFIGNRYLHVNSTSRFDAGPSLTASFMQLIRPIAGALGFRAGSGSSASAANGAASGMRAESRGSRRLEQMDDAVEFAYAFDVHLNAILPGLVLIHIVQLPVLYFILSHETSFWSVLVGNSCWLVSAAYYLYISFLGYSALPFLRNTRIFLTPGSIILLLFILSLFFRWNVTAAIAAFYEYRLGSQRPSH